jgi:teichuronic acid biosynthesis glycosyltransferase TuaH
MLVRLQIRLAVMRLHGRSIARVLASDLPIYGRARGERRILYVTDDWLEGAALMGLSRPQIERNELRLARQTDLVVAVSEPLARKWRKLGCKVIVVPNGCDTRRFAGTDRAAYPVDVNLPQPIAGFVGQINDRLDVDRLAAVAARGHSLLLVGPLTRMSNRRSFDELIARSNVQWIGARPFDVMPSYMRAIHVGLTPYADTPFNRSSFPLKTIEYLAAGRAAVCSDLPSARSLATKHVTLAKTSQEFVNAVESRLAEPLDPFIMSQRRKFATAYDWSVRSRRFAKLIGVADSRRQAARHALLASFRPN